MSTLENDVLIPKCNLLHNGRISARISAPKKKMDSERFGTEWKQMDSSIIDLALGSWGGTPAKKKKKKKKLLCSLITSQRPLGLWARFSHPNQSEFTTTQVFEEELAGASVKHRAKKNLK